MGKEGLCTACPNCRGHLYEFPRVVCLIGSMQFAAEFHAQNVAETLQGHIVLAPGVNTKVIPVSEAEKFALDHLHLRKIEMADEVMVINPGGYIGESTRREIMHAVQQRKPIRWLVPMSLATL